MIDMTESTELQAFKRQKDGYKVTVKFPYVFVLFYRETNSKSGKIYFLATMKYTLVCLPAATVYWHKSLEKLLPCLFMILAAVSMIKLCSTF